MFTLPPPSVDRRNDVPGNSDIICYTDGSKSPSGLSGLGIWIPLWNWELAMSTGNYMSVFQCEAMAVNHGLAKILGMGTWGKKINIFSDSQAVIKAIKSPIIKSNIILRITETCSRLAMKGNEITITWIPAHQGIFRQ